MWIFEFIVMCVFGVIAIACTIVQQTVQCAINVLKVLEVGIELAIRLIRFSCILYRTGYAMGQRMELALNYVKSPKTKQLGKAS